MKTALWAALLLAAAPASALETASFLDLGAGARELAMGGAGTAVSDDADAIWWNPAGLASVERGELDASHAALGAGARHEFLAAAHSVPGGALAAAGTYLGQDSIDGRDAAGRATGGWSASDAAVAVAAARRGRLGDAGAGVKYARSRIGAAEARTVAFDLGLRGAAGPYDVGLAVRNLGPGLKFDAETDDLPLRVALGVARRLGAGLVAADLIDGPRGEGLDAALGGELRAVDGVFLRAGWTTKASIAGGAGFDAARGLTLGLGARRPRWGVDYAAEPLGELGSAQRFTLAWRF